jgi:hypothetical protein
VVAASILVAPAQPLRAFGLDLPDRLSDQEFWALSQNSSEPGGYFRAENITNLTSNELGFELVLPELLKRAHQGGVYLGVGPEQNYTYIAELHPKLVVIFDIRRGNLDLQLMYKAIFEMSKDRADFVSLLFAKPRPAGLTAASTVEQLFAAFAGVTTSQDAYRANLKAIDDRITKTHAIALSADDLQGLEAVYNAFYQSGYYVRASPSYAELMMAVDPSGTSRSFLATEDRFAVLKDLESRNLVVPVVGDFGGPKAIRAIGAYLKAHGGVVSAFYLSNVEQYLEQDGKWNTFCRNVATLPLDDGSTFIRSASGRGATSAYGRGPGFVSSLGAMKSETAACGAAR